MTKQEIRSISIAKLKLKCNSILIDVGAGTGSVAIEASTYLSEGRVYAIEKEELGCELIKKNSEKFSCNNLEIIKGKAPSSIPNIEYDAMFIGGSGGELEDILEHFLKYATKDATVVINIIALESLELARALLKKMNFKNVETCSVAVSRAKKIGEYTMMFGENPIYIISAIKGGRDE